MTQPDRVALLGELYEIFDFKAFGDGVLDERFAAHLTDDFLFRLPSTYPDVGEQRGIEGAKSFFRMLGDVWDQWWFEVEEFVEGDDVVLAMVHLHAKGKGSGVELHSKPAHLWRFKGDKAVGVEVFLDRDEALAAAGLRSGP